MALRALPESMAGAIHFVPRSKPPHIGQFWCFHVSKFPTRGTRLPDPVDCSQQPLPHLAIVDEANGDYALVLRHGTASRTQRRGDFEREDIVDVTSRLHSLTRVVRAGKADRLPRRLCPAPTPVRARLPAARSPQPRSQPESGTRILHRRRFPGAVSSPRGPARPANIRLRKPGGGGRSTP